MESVLRLILTKHHKIYIILRLVIADKLLYTISYRNKEKRKYRLHGAYLKLRLI